MIKLGYICDLCGEADTDPSALAVHQQRPITTYGFAGGELISYGSNCGSGINVAVILEPVHIDRSHIQRYSTLGLTVLFGPDQAQHNHTITERGFPPLSLDDVARNKLDPITPNPEEYRQRNPLKELTPEQFMRINILLTDPMRGVPILGGYAKKAFGQDPKCSALEVITHFYPHIMKFSLGHLKSGEELIYDGH